MQQRILSPERLVRRDRSVSAGGERTPAEILKVKEEAEGRRKPEACGDGTASGTGIVHAV